MVDIMDKDTSKDFKDREIKWPERRSTETQADIISKAHNLLSRG